MTWCWGRVRGNSQVNIGDSQERSLTTRESSSHSVFENGTMLREPDIKLSVYGLWSKKGTEMKMREGLT